MQLQYYTARVYQTIFDAGCRIHLFSHDFFMRGYEGWIVSLSTPADAAIFSVHTDRVFFRTPKNAEATRELASIGKDLLSKHHWPVPTWVRDRKIK